MTENVQTKPVIEMRDITKIYHIGGEESGRWITPP